MRGGLWEELKHLRVIFLLPVPVVLSLAAIHWNLAAHIADVEAHTEARRGLTFVAQNPGAPSQPALSPPASPPFNESLNMNVAQQNFNSEQEFSTQILCLVGMLAVEGVMLLSFAFHF